jgi:hypothetical protein
MGTFQIPDLEPLLPELVETVVTPLFEEETNLYMQFLAGEGDDINGRGKRITDYISPNESGNFFSEAGNYAVPGKEEFAEMRVYPTRSSFGLEWSGDVLDSWKTASDVIDGMSDKLKRATSAYKKFLQRYLFGIGDGALGVIATAGVAGSVITFSTTVADGSTKGATYIKKRQRVHWYTSAGVQKVTTNPLSTVVSKTSSVVTFDVVPSNPLVATDIAVPEGSFNKAFHGIKHLISSANTMLQGQLRSTYPQLKSQEIDAAGANVTVALLSKTKAAQKFLAAEDASAIMLLSSVAQKNLYERQGFNLIRLQQGDKFTGTLAGHNGVGHLDSDWKDCPDCDEDRIYGMGRRAIRRYELKPFGFYNYDGQNFVRKGAGGANSDAITGWLGVKTELGILNPQECFVIKGLSITDAPTAVSALAY